MRFYADELYIKKFRKIEDQNIKLGKKITVISGQNGVGKSNIMSLITSTFGQSKRRFGKGNFQPEFSDYFTIPEGENYQEYQTYIKVTQDGNPHYIQKRHAYKDDTATDRGIRIIPRTTNFYDENITLKDTKNIIKSNFEIGSDARVPLPTIFLSLSRLYPVGETELASKDLRSNNRLIQNQSIEKYIQWYNAVLPNSISPEESDITIINKQKIDNDGIYVGLDKTTEHSQSVGQDNLRGIINSLVDFYNLKKQNEEKYNGGVLCIDELDASLHPSAQLRLFNLLNELCEILKLQVIITTHSLTLLKIIINLRKTQQDDYNLIYLIDPIQPKVTTISSYNHLKADLFDTQIKLEPTIKLYCEDKIAESLFSELISTAEYLFSDKMKLGKHKIIPVHLGSNQLTQLIKHDNHFKEVGIVLDGDAKTNAKSLLNNYINDKDSLNGYNAKKQPDNVVTLPTFLAPESYMYFIIHEMFHKLEYKDFWGQLANTPETMYYSKNRVQVDILSKVTICDETKNDDIKSARITQNMLNFIKDTDALTNYYILTDSNELESFYDNSIDIIDKLKTNIKAKY